MRWLAETRKWVLNELKADTERLLTHFGRSPELLAEGGNSEAGLNARANRRVTANSLFAESGGRQNEH